LPPGGQKHKKDNACSNHAQIGLRGRPVFSLRRKSPKIKGFEDFVQQRFPLQVQYLHRQKMLSEQ